MQILIDKSASADTYRDLTIVRINKTFLEEFMSFTKPLLQCALAAAIGGISLSTQALNILLVNDDGLTSNTKALYEVLKTAGHDVVVSVPCTGQSGRSGGIVMYSASVIVADNDSQVTTNGGCLNGAALIGQPAVGPMTKTGFDNGDYYYVHGTPVMATYYGLDVAAVAHWGKAPDLVLSGPNEGQNLGFLVNNSGTIGNAQAAAARGLPSIALSAGSNTADNTNLANPRSAVVAQLTLQLIQQLQATTPTGPLLPQGLVLNVNFPNAITTTTPFHFSRLGTYQFYSLGFKNSVPYSITGRVSSAAPTVDQAQDETVVSQSSVSVSPMQVGYAHNAYGEQWLQLRLRDLLQ